MLIKRNSLYLVFLAVVTALSLFLFMYLVGADALHEKNRFQFFADSTTYLLVAKGDHPLVAPDESLMGIGSTYLGPVLLSRFLGHNFYAICLFNVLIFFSSIYFICNKLKINSFLVAFVLLLNPLTLSSIASLNKEIFIFPFLAFFVFGYVNNSLKYFIFAFLMCFFIRWHMFAFCLFFLAANYIKINRKLFVFIALIVLSFAYILLSNAFSMVLENVKYSIDNYDGGGTGVFVWLLSLQEIGLYVLVFPLKSAQLLFATGISSLINGRLFDIDAIYNYTFVALHCLLLLILFLVLLFRKKLKFSNDLYYLSIIFISVFALSPVFAARYFYLVYVVWVFILCGAPEKIRLNKFRRCNESIVH